MLGKLSVTGPAADVNAAILYKMQKGVMTSGRDYHDNAFSLGGAGSLKSTLADMKKYICMYLNYGKGIDGTRICRVSRQAMTP